MLVGIKNTSYLMDELEKEYKNLKETVPVNCDNRNYLKKLKKAYKNTKEKIVEYIEKYSSVRTSHSKMIFDFYNQIDGLNVNLSNPKKITENEFLDLAHKAAEKGKRYLVVIDDYPLDYRYVTIIGDSGFVDIYVDCYYNSDDILLYSTNPNIKGEYNSIGKAMEYVGVYRQAYKYACLKMRNGVYHVTYVTNDPRTIDNYRTDICYAFESKNDDVYEARRGLQHEAGEEPPAKKNPEKYGITIREKFYNGL